MKIETYNKIIQRAKEKKDGIYRYDGFAYVVIDKSPRIIVTDLHYGGDCEVFQPCYGFLVSLGIIDSLKRNEYMRKFLKENKR